MTKHPPKKETASCAIIEKRNNSVPQKEKHLTQIKEWDFEGAKQEFKRTIALKFLPAELTKDCFRDQNSHKFDCEIKIQKRLN